MAKLGPEYIGKLPPGASEELARELQSCKESAKLGIVKGIKILGGPGCAVSEAQQGTVYPVNKVPKLPFKGCKREPCCGCCYISVLS